MAPPKTSSYYQDVEGTPEDKDSAGLEEQNLPERSANKVENYPNVGFYDPTLNYLCRLRPILLRALQLQRQYEILAPQSEPTVAGVVQPTDKDWREEWVEQADNYLLIARHFLTNILPKHSEQSAQDYQDFAKWITDEVREEARAERQILIEDKYEDVPDNDGMDARHLFQVWQERLQALLAKFEHDRKVMGKFPAGYQTRFNQEAEFITAKMEQQSARNQQWTEEVLDHRLRTVVLPYIERLCDYADEALKGCFPEGYQGWRTAELPPWMQNHRQDEK